MAAYTSETAKFLQSVSSDQTWWKSRYNPETAFPILAFIDVQSAEKRSPVTATTRSRRKTTISTVSNKQSNGN
ncbi:hypothetical protein P8773_27110 [Klebsiella pneumoniae]